MYEVDYRLRHVSGVRGKGIFGLLCIFRNVLVCSSHGNVERKRKRDRERDRERERERMCVCVREKEKKKKERQKL